MKDILEENMKYEGKIRYNSLLQDYYKGSLTWLQLKDEQARIGASAKAILDEADVKPSYRTDLENKEFPLTDFIMAHR